MDLRELLAYLAFGGYFALIGGSLYAVIVSILSGGSKPAKLAEGRPFLFIRAAFGALVCTWYFMIQYMKWSYTTFAYLNSNDSIGQWLVKTSLFDQAWRVVCVGPGHWWWSSWICTSAVVFSAIVWRESTRRGIKFPLAYMVLGQLVAISFAMALFFTAVYMHTPRTGRERSWVPFQSWFPLFIAFIPIHFIPRYAETRWFLTLLGAVHLLVILPLVSVSPHQSKEPSNAHQSRLAISFGKLIGIIIVSAAFIHVPNTLRFLAIIPDNRSAVSELLIHIFAHPAQTSVSLDVCWVGINLILLSVSAGSTFAVIAKTASVAFLGFVGLARFLGVNWGLIASIVPILNLLFCAGIIFALGKVRSRNSVRRAALLESLGIKEHGPIPGTKNKAPQMAVPRTIVGFWHPYCNAGGGGERVLWSAIAYLQRKQSDTVIIVYSGDYPAASKDEILAKVQDRFSIELSPKTLQFIPLPSRYLISDSYWTRFTLLGQSLGSLWLAWEGLCGKDGMWGDIFIDSMGYAFTMPFIRLVVGSEIVIGSYVHYPTVSSDMVKRVRERSAGVENGGVADSTVRTWIKLVYYRVFTWLYAMSLLFSEHTMTNSSWTQAHIQSLMTKGRSTTVAGILLLDDLTHERREARGEATPEDRPRCEVVYPPCDTAVLSKLVRLDKRSRVIVSLAQFRPEKEHAKQLYAMQSLFVSHPQYRDGPESVHLTLMGGSRGFPDEARLESLKQLAIQLDISKNVTFLVNAPYSEIVRRLGDASLGLNTMQDEHFGINVVEFMAAGLIPIVHASAGPLMDIVVPHHGQRTGFHATDPESFANAIHEALTLSPTQQLRTRKAARAAAIDKFSLAEFERGFARGFARLRRAVEQRRAPV